MMNSQGKVSASEHNNEFGGTMWLWSMLFNFGGNTGLGGGLDHVASEPIEASQTANYMKGVAIAPEGGDTNPALYGLMAEMTWRSEIPDVEQWLKDYAKRRYGAENYELAQEEIDDAWDTLHSTVYSEFVSGDGPSQTLVNAMPKLSGAIARVNGSNDKVYETQEIFSVWKNMLKAAEKMENPTPQFLYDLVDITRQVLADISGEVYTNIKPNFDNRDKENTMKYANLMIEICYDLDKILATNEEFLIGTRLEGAKNRGVTDSDKDFYEEVERTFLTYWILNDPEKGSQGLIDYCNRHLSGLMTDYYGMRWEVFAKYLEEALNEGMNADQFNSVQQPKIKQEILSNASAWADDNTPYTTETTGDTIQVSKELWEKYQPLMTELYGDFENALDASNDLSVEGLTAIAGSQQAENGSEGPAVNVLDNDTDTIWHSAWSGTGRENLWIEIQLPASTLVNGLRYLTRSSGGTNGIITKYRIEISNDYGVSYTEVCSGEWSTVTGWKLASFEAEEVTNVRLYAVDSLTQDGNNYASAAEIRLTVPSEEPVVPTNPFTDVFENDYYYTPTLWAVAKEITDGTSDTTFSPNQNCTRGHVVTFLWRANGCPEPSSATCDFTDIHENDYYYKAVLWAKEQGITDGTSDTKFSPNAECTRGQIVTFLWREADEPEAAAVVSGFTDVPVNAYYEKAVLWAVERGITEGTAPGVFSPDMICTRGQTVTFIYRAAEN